MNLGIIGNCQYSALIAPSGNVDWLCWPRFDSSFVFGKLLDEARGGRFQIGPADPTAVGEQTYIENTNVLRTRFESERGSFEVVDFAPRFYQYDRFFRPNLLMRIVRPLRGEPLVRVECTPRYDYGRLELSADPGSNHIHFSGAPQPVRLTTEASLALVLERRPFALTSTQYFALSWGRPLHAPLRTTCEDFLERTILYWRRWVKHCLLPREFQKEVIRSALALKVHQYEDTGAIIASTTTSIPEAKDTVRNWDYRYCWLRDAYLTIAALQKLTHFEELERFEGYLRNIAETRGFVLQPVYGISGEARLTEVIDEQLEGYRGHKPVRIGNQAFEHLQHDLYGEMVLAISPLFLDIRFTGPQAGPLSLLSKLLAGIETYLEKPDAGLWEFRENMQLHTFTILMHWAGARKACEIARACGSPEIAARGERVAGRAREILDTLCYSRELGVYTQAAGSRAQDAALLMLVNLRYLRADDPRAVRQIEVIVDKLGTPGGLIRRYVTPDDFGMTQNAFTICNFWLAEAYARVGLRDRARKLFDRLLSSANHLGLYSEDLDPDSLEQWGNFPQTYSHVGLVNAAFAISEPWE
jgi:GH15 family glucan-1,4-alpha-glucosidase